ncbi:hypothetical protein [Thiohalorhabdus methylotrophus]|uniref:Uncharacterized protein n=1 Tax=Thiohalorhabdus methylotrophus TaxID=3242694 RepID=A0ABV4TZM8_9GAMM
MGTSCSGPFRDLKTVGLILPVPWPLAGFRQGKETCVKNESV